MNKLCALLILAGLPLSFAAKFPDEVKYNPETFLLTTGKNAYTGFYSENKLDSIFIEVDSDTWGDDIDKATNRGEYVVGKITFDGETLDSVGIQYKGMTSQINVRDNYGRKSFDIKLDEFIDGQDIQGYNTLNLNNAYDDESLMREVLFAHYCRNHIPAIKANFINVFVNGNFHGVYTNAQQQNKDFVSEWFWSNNGSRYRAESSGAGFGAGKSSLNYVSPYTEAEYQRHYVLKASDMPDPWGDLMETTKRLDNVTANNLDDLKEVLDLDGALWFLGYEIAFMDEDGYVNKGGMDYAIYIDEVTGRLLPLELDGNSALFEMSGLGPLDKWEPDERSDDSRFPLLSKLMNIEEVRGRHYAHFRTILKESFNPNDYETLIDGYYDLIKTDIARDQVLAETFGYDVEDGKEEIKDIMERRRNFLEGLPELMAEGPEITDVKFSTDNGDNTAPDEGQDITVSAKVSSGNGIEEVNLFYSYELTGNFEKKAMSTQGGTYTATIDGQDEGTYIRFYIEGVAGNSYKSRSYNPPGAEHDVYMVQVNFKSITTASVVINEFMASNNETEADENGEFEDWVELYNNSDEDVSLEGYFLSDNSLVLDQWQFPDVTIKANSYLTVWLDKQPEQGNLHANIKLSSGGEELVLADSDKNIIDVISFGEQQTDVSTGRFPNGTGNFIEMEPTFGSKNKGDGSNDSSSSQDNSSSSDGTNDSSSSEDASSSSSNEDSSSSDSDKESSSSEQNSLSSDGDERSSSSKDVTPILDFANELETTVQGNVLSIYNENGVSYRVQIVDASGRSVLNLHSVNQVENRIYLDRYVRDKGYYFINVRQETIQSTVTFFNY